MHQQLIVYLYTCMWISTFDHPSFKILIVPKVFFIYIFFFQFIMILWCQIRFNPMDWASTFALFVIIEMYWRARNYIHECESPFSWFISYKQNKFTMASSLSDIPLKKLCLSAMPILPLIFNRINFILSRVLYQMRSYHRNTPVSFYSHICHVYIYTCWVAKRSLQRSIQI